MVVAIRALDTAGRPEPAARFYRILGERVRSEVALPLPEEAAGEFTIAIRVAPPDQPVPVMTGQPRGLMRCEHGTVRSVRYADESGCWLDNGASLLHIAADGDRIDLYLDRSPDQHELALLLIGQMVVFLARARRKLVLHASAILHDGSAVAFLAPSGGGKSSIAAGFALDGTAPITDDVLVLDQRQQGAYALPSVAVMKLWQRSLDGVGVASAALAAVAPGIDKKLLQLHGRLRPARHAAPLRVLYRLERYESVAGETAIEIMPMTGGAALAALVEQTSWSELLAPEEIGALLPHYVRLLARTPLRRLRYPSGFEHQERVRDAVLADLAAL